MFYFFFFERMMRRILMLRFKTNIFIYLIFINFKYYVVVCILFRVWFFHLPIIFLYYLSQGEGRWKHLFQGKIIIKIRKSRNLFYDNYIYEVAWDFSQSKKMLNYSKLINLCVFFYHARMICSNKKNFLIKRSWEKELTGLMNTMKSIKTQH